MTAVLVALAGLGCGSGQHAGSDVLIDRPRPDAGPGQVDANYDACSLGFWDVQDPVSTHAAVLDYDKPLHDNMARNDPDATVAAFLDGEGVAVFGYRHFVRATLDGNFVSSVAFPTDPTSGHELWADSTARPVQSPSVYGAPLLDGAGSRFCLVQMDGTVDLAICSAIPDNTGMWAPVWDGAAFRLVATFGWGAEAKRYVLAYDPLTGQMTSQVLLPGAYGRGSTRPFFYPDRVELFSGGGRPDTACYSFFFEVLPPSLSDTGRQEWDLLPTDFRAGSWWDAASSGRSTVLRFTGECWQRPPWATYPTYVACSEPYPPAPPTGDFLAFIDPTGSPPAPVRVSGGIHVLSWSGEQFVDFREIDLVLYDEDGRFVARAGLPAEFPIGVGMEILGVRLLPVGPWDYLYFYSVAGTSITHMARFHLVPL
ncbi:MAG: hypothetical protein HY906_04350 [Deltaproteobacteria bacterium]|nr:hypothetical protein [Deltaproteobacteria bacterium]